MNRISPAGACLLGALLLCAGLLAPAWAALSDTREPLVQTVDVQIPVAPTPFTVAGTRHLAYELHITNLRPVDVALTRVEVLDERGARLADYSDADLMRRLGRPGARPDLSDARRVGAGMRAVMFLWMPLSGSAATPATLQHRIAFDILRPAGTEHALALGIGTPVRHQSPVVLQPPLRGGPWAALYDPMMAQGHRTSIYTINGRARIPARFAIDWIRLNDDASRARGDGSRIANWHGYGAEVLAVADAVVAEARDDIAEDATIAVAQAPVPLENASGNYVTLDLGDGRFAFYEHLQRGSVRVKRGERVTAGEVIGRLGNSGSSSSGPHLHFHVADANATLAAEGLPYVFERFEVLGGYERIDGVGSGERWQPLPADQDGVRALELPAANAVVKFSGSAAAR